MDLKKKIIDFCKSIGIDKIGFVKCERFYELEEYFKYKKSKDLLNDFEEDTIENRVNPKLIMPQGKTIISIALPYMTENIEKQEQYFSSYALGEDYHNVVNLYLEKISTFIEKLGGITETFVDNNPLPERYIAMKAGIGFIGKNNCLITEEYGSYVFLGEIITDLEVEESTPKESKCGNCNKCIDICPTKAILSIDTNKNIKGIENNSNICLSYVTQKKNLEDFWFKKFEGRIWGCDKCQDICPFNKNVQNSRIVEFQPKEYMKNPNLEEIIQLDNKTFKEKYKITSCGWRGKNILIRNSLISYYNLNGYIPKLQDIGSPYIKEYYERIMKRMKE